nr:putative ribonuclease H-like domain-containing protein [Tanacetum cinerariifolium]
RLISWQCKKQTIVATSTTEAEYVAAASCCGQVLWIQNQLLDYGNTIMARLQFYDYHNMVAILEKSEHNADFHHMVDFIEASPLRIVPFFDTMLVQQGEGSGTPTKPHHTPSPEAQSPPHTTHTSPTLTPVTTTSLPIVTQLKQHLSGNIPEELGLPNQDRATINKLSTFPYDSAQRVTSPVADEGSMQQIIPELMALCISLQRKLSEFTDKFQAQEVEINRLMERVKMLEDRERVAATRSGDDAPIKGRSINAGEAATERISNDSEEMATALTSMNATIVLASGVVDIPTSSGSIPTASTPAEEQVSIGSDVVLTASLVFATATVVTPYRRRKGKEVMKVQEQIDAQVARELEEQLEREDQRRSEQIARDAEIARIHVEEELQILFDGLDRNNETVAKYLQEYHQFALELPIERRIELISDLVKYQDHYAKRKEIRLEQEEVKKMKTSEEVPEEVKSSEEVSKEKIKEMIQLVPIEEVYVEALQVKHPIIDWKVHTEGHKAYWKITSLVKEILSNRPLFSDKEMELWVELNRLYEPDNEDQLWTHTHNFMHALVEWKLYDTCGVHHVTSKDKEIFMLVEKDYPLRKGLALVMISYKLQVENYSQMANDLVLKIYKIANSPRQQGD